MLTLTINGQAKKVDAEPDTPLLWVLREQLGLTGTKYGCGIEVCGACTVLLDGESVKSCTVLAAQASGHAVTTIEGLATGGTLGIGGIPKLDLLGFALLSLCIGSLQMMLDRGESLDWFVSTEVVLEGLRRLRVGVVEAALGERVEDPGAVRTGGDGEGPGRHGWR